jgi:predicted nucleic acid-binding protein
MIRIGLDTSIMVVVEGFVRASADAPQIERGRRLVRQIAQGANRPLVPLEALAELHDALVRHARLDVAEANIRTAAWRRASEAAFADQAAFDLALELAAGHELPIRDAICLAVAALARCAVLLSQTLPDGLAVRGTIVSNPFGPRPDARIAPLLV